MTRFHPPDAAPSETRGWPDVHGSPTPGLAPEGEQRCALYTEAFAADPHLIYDTLREQYGALAPVELAPGVPATLVVRWDTAVRILNDEAHFPADPRIWQRSAPADSPILPMVEWRPNALRSAGAEHERYRRANVHALDTVNLHRLHDVVEKTAAPLVQELLRDTTDTAQPGRAELLGQYVYPLVYQMLDHLLGFDAETSAQVGAGMAAIFDASTGAEAGNRMLQDALANHLRRVRESPGGDMTSELIAHSGLNDEEIIHQLVTLHGAGSEPLVHLISNTLLLLMTDDRFAGGLLDGSLLTRDALDSVLFRNPPLANYCITYPRQPILIDDVWLPAHQPVVISMAACNNDPAVQASDILGNRSHLAWSAGPHSCPARTLGYQVAVDAIDYLLDGVPEIELAVHPSELTWRPGPFHRALNALPVAFPTHRR